jgi:hypothetical protein
LRLVTGTFCGTTAAVLEHRAYRSGLQYQLDLAAPPEAMIAPPMGVPQAGLAGLGSAEAETTLEAVVRSEEVVRFGEHDMTAGLHIRYG